jgi:hypothetical protein
MTPQHNGEPIRYNVQMGGPVKNWLRTMHRLQAEAGKGKAFVAALRKIVEHLQVEPLVFGEPRYRLPTLQLLVRQGAVRPLVVSYAVHETQPLVFIRYFSLLS